MDFWISFLIGSLQLNLSLFLSQTWQMYIDKVLLRKDAEVLSTSSFQNCLVPLEDHLLRNKIEDSWYKKKKKKNGSGFKWFVYFSDWAWGQRRGPAVGGVETENQKAHQLNQVKQKTFHQVLFCFLVFFFSF